MFSAESRTFGGEHFFFKNENRFGYDTRFIYVINI